jgi:hypothetical protein
MNGTRFAAGDGRIAEAIVRTGYQFAAFPFITNLNPLQGFGTQLLPMNVWINPVHWPLAVLDGKLATDTAGLVVSANDKIGVSGHDSSWILPRAPYSDRSTPMTLPPCRIMCSVW